MSTAPQPSILSAPSAYGRSLTLRRPAGVDARAALARLAAGWRPEWGVIGLGSPLVRACGGAVAGLRPFPSIESPFSLPVTQAEVWLFLRGEDRSTVFDRGEALAEVIAGAFEVADSLETFLYAGGRDLTGYEDGTANPEPEAAVEVAICGADMPIPGSSFVAVQRWVHDLARFAGHDRPTRDAMIGRRFADNEEIEDAPESAHVKRTAQELYEPEAFMLRRSQPFADTAAGRGLEFVAYCRTLDAFERMLRHMAGLDDGISDALFDFSRPVTGGYYWCPPLVDGRLDVTALGA